MHEQLLLPSQHVEDKKPRQSLMNFIQRFRKKSWFDRRGVETLKIGTFALKMVRYDLRFTGHFEVMKMIQNDTSPILSWVTL